MQHLPGVSGVSAGHAVRLLWAKTDRAHAGTSAAWHPLLCHLLDVAAVALQLWKGALPDSTRAAMSAAAGLSASHAGRFFAFWAGLHDIGKASPGFQSLDEGHRARLRAAGLNFPPRSCRLHGLLTADAMTHYLTSDDETRGQRAVVRALASAIGGHHGAFPGARELLDLTPRDRGDDTWEAARLSLIEDLAHLLDVTEPVPSDLSGRDHRFFMFLAGLVSVADWIGSAERWFPFEAYPDDPHTYFSDARQKAARAIDAIGWSCWQPSEEDLEFTDFFGFERPNAMQQQVLSLAPQSGRGELVIIEAPMGEGKTEAALYLVDRWNRTQAERGCYVAMPTQATANAMFDRFREDYLSKRYPDQWVDLQLVHGHAALSAAYQQLREIGQVWDQEDDEEEPGGAVVASEWFGYRNRGLLGPFGVGTVDQALLAAMQASHSFVRLFGLAGKAVIFDEVHAFDTYTSTLLDRLLSWLGALGCPVVLLSATLPPSRRRSLLQAYAGEDAPQPDVPYPRLVRVSEQRTDAATWDSDSKRVEVGWTDPDPNALAEVLSTALSGGGCAAVICNTVRRAQDVFGSLRERLSGQIEVDLFHARFPFNERDRREKRAIERFGKGDANRPERAVLVATQVIEQSLDLDFDIMVSEVAPVDLLLQRSGRMHRHDRQRPPGLESPRLLLMQAERNEDGVPQFGDSKWIYGDELLLKTWIALRDRDHFRVPDDVEDLICEVYERNTEPRDDTLSAAVADARQEAEQKRRRLENEGARRRLPPPDLDEDFCRLPVDLSLEESNPELHRHYRALTRWQERPSAEVVCLENVDGRPHVRCGEELLAVDLSAEPSEHLEEKLVRRSVSISGQAARELLDHDGPSGWRRSSLLRHHRAVVFDESGWFAGDRFQLRNDPELGIVIPRNDDGED